jgi:AcrR family transcriptional regulator
MTTPTNETSERILNAAEALFMARGYDGVKLRDIAEAVGMRHASLYYYVPGGKEQLFVTVLRRSMARHEAGMARLMAEAGDEIRAQAYAVSDWLVSQPPLELVRMFEADLRAVDPAVAQELANLVFESLTRPLVAALQQAQQAGTVAVEDAAMAAMALLTLIQSVHQIPVESLPGGRQALGRKLVDMLLVGWLAR